MFGKYCLSRVERALLDLAEFQKRGGLEKCFNPARVVDARKLDEVAFHRAVVSEMCGLLGFLQSDPDAWFQGGADEELTARVEALITARAEARKAKDWPAADRIRAELTELGVEVMDGPQGATWRLRGSEGSP